MKMKIKSIITVLFFSCLSLILIEVCLGLYYKSSDFKGTDKNTERILSTGVYKNVNSETVKAIYRELRLHKTTWQPYVHYRLDSVNLKFSKTNKNGVRRTLNLNLKDATKAYKIYCFGGSTMFGFGARDQFTIPSELSKIIHSQYPNINIEIVNYGVQGYTRSMENIQYMNLILEENKPDLAIFYDGANEVLSAFQNNKAGLPTNAINRKNEFRITQNYTKRIKFIYQYSHTKRFVTGLHNSIFKGSKYPKPSLKPDELALKIASSYKNKVEMLDLINANTTTKIVNFLQPNLYSKSNYSKAEVGLENDSNYYKNLFNISYNLIINDSLFSSKHNFHDISDAFNTEKETIYVDFCHTGEYGNKIIAKRIFDRIKSDLIIGEHFEESSL
jgi:lysophospholipase L1-like esterase